MFCALCTENCPVDCIFMGSTHDLSCYARDGCIVDFSRLPVEIAWGRSTLNPTVVAESKAITDPVHEGPS
jgi:NADH-quinone oxidoreductase subunit I